MESADGLDPQHVVSAPPVADAGFSEDLHPPEAESFSVLISASDQLTSFVLPDGSGTVHLTSLPRPSSSANSDNAVHVLKQQPPVMQLDALSALVDVAVSHPLLHTSACVDPDPDDPPLEETCVEETAVVHEPRVVRDLVHESGVVRPGGGDVSDGGERCLVCNSHHSDGERVSLFGDASREPALRALEAAVEAALDPHGVHSQVLCSACFNLADRLDRLQEELRQTRDAVRSLYWHTAALYSAVHESHETQETPGPAEELETPDTPHIEHTEQQQPQRRRPQRASTQHEPGHYRSMAEGQQDSPPSPSSLPPPEADDRTEPPLHCKELDVAIHVQKASPKKKSAIDNEDRLTCSYCCKTFQRPARLKQHMATHTAEGSATNQCHLCSKTFSQKYYLREHIKQVHERRSLHSCDQCGKVFLRRLHLDDHMRTHSGDRPYTCDVCGRGFSQRGNLRTHAMVHTDQFSFQCDSCGKRLRTRQALEAHQRKHNDDRRFSCNMCTASYLLKRSLERHQRKHTGDRPFKCSQCDRAFRDRGDLRCHEGIHSASRAHVCPLCGQGFTRRYKMQTHLRAKHDKTDHQVQELCLLQQTAHTMLQQSQQKMEPMTVLDVEDASDHQDYTADPEEQEHHVHSQDAPLLVLDPLPPPG